MSHDCISTKSHTVESSNMIVTETDLPWSEVCHSSGHLVRSRYQLPDLQTAQRSLPGAAPVLQPDRSTGTEVLPQVTLWGVLHHHIQRAWQRRTGGGGVIFNVCTTHITTDQDPHTHRPECRLPAGWWCSCVCQSSSSFPFQRSGQTGPSLWRPLHTTTSEVSKVSFSGEMFYMEQEGEKGLGSNLLNDTAKIKCRGWINSTSQKKTTW